MQALGLLGNAFVSILNPASILLMVAGVAIGIIFGSIPGLSASMAVALMLPLTFSMTPSLGMNTLAGSCLYWRYFGRFDFRNSSEYAWYSIIYRYLL